MNHQSVSTVQNTTEFKTMQATTFLKERPSILD